MKKGFELKSSEIDFSYVWKIGKIDVDRVTFVKYNIDKNQSVLGNNKETVVLKEVIGEETHKCQPAIIEALSGRVGDVVKGFKTEKKSRVVKVSKVIELDVNSKQEMK
jgi:hypothetical protein